MVLGGIGGGKSAVSRPSPPSDDNESVPVLIEIPLISEIAE